MRILVVEDDARIAAFLVKGLTAEGWQTIVAADVPSASAALSTAERPDLVLLDLGLPGGSGEYVLTSLRAKDTSTPVIVLTARTDVADKVRHLDLGANDYMTKPFAFAELLARIRAAVRTKDQPTTSELVIGDLRFDLLTKVAYRAGRRIDLAPREWALLEMFMRNPTHVISRTRILSEVWSYDYDPGSNVVDVYVGYLRKKLNRGELTPLIQTVRGVGYRMLPPG